MSIFQDLALGFAVVFTPFNLFMAAVGSLLGLLVGALPGLGPSAAIAILLPVTFGMDPASALIMLTAIYYGAMFGGSITSVLINTPGENSAVMTAVEGYPLAMQGKASVALRMSLIASFLGGTLSVVGLTLLAPPLTRLAIQFGPPEYFALMTLGLMAVVFVGGSSSITKCFISAVFGLVIGSIGTEPISGFYRLTFGSPELTDGIPFIVVAMGLFAIGEVFVNVERNLKLDQLKEKIKNLWPSREDFKRSRYALGTGSVLGFVIGVLPGAGPTIASFLSYAVERGRSKEPQRFGKGAVEGIAAVESANNAATGGSMVPLLTLGVPGSGATAVLLGALMMYGLRPGPLLFSQHPDIAWGVIASMYIGNLLIIALALPLVPFFNSLLKIPYAVLYPLIIVICLIGAYSLTNTLFPVWLMLIFGVVGYFMNKLDIPAAPAVLGLILGPMVETALSQSLTMSHGSMLIFFNRPIALMLMLCIFAVFIAPLAKRMWSVKKAAA
ncbi:MAG: tripartite tricarboxylate transporter permease [Bacillota bacterium]